MRRLTILLVAVGALMLVPAAQAFANPTLTVFIEGTGSGEVSSVGGVAAASEAYEEFGNLGEGNPAIECTYTSPGPEKGACENEMDEFEGGRYVDTMLATPASGSEFAGWIEEAGEASLEQCTSEKLYCLPYSEGGNAEWAAIFNECEEGSEAPTCAEEGPVTPTALTIAKTGEGSVISSPAGIECTGAKTGAECEHAFEVNEMVTLTASPATGYAFSAWAGCTEHVGLTCKVKMEKAKTVKVGFVATPSLTIEKAGSGQGKVGAPGISCDENCSKASSAVKTGASVTVKATPAKGSEAAVFEGGTGSASGCSGAVCTFTISANSSVKVKFNAIPTKTMTVNLTGPAKYKGKVSGKGIVKGLTGAAINCGAGCTSQTESFFSTDEVTLSAAAGTGYTFGGWSVSGGSAGTCTGTTTPCTVKTDADKTISAEFK